MYLKNKLYSVFQVRPSLYCYGNVCDFFFFFVRYNDEYTNDEIFDRTTVIFE